MPFAFIIAGIVLLVSGVRGTSQTLISLLKGEVVGQNNFIYWILSILIIGALGYIEDFRSLSRAFLALIIVVLVLAEDKNGQGGFFVEFQNAIKQITSGSGSGGNFLAGTSGVSFSPTSGGTTTGNSRFYANNPNDPESAFYVPPKGYYVNNQGQLVPNSTPSQKFSTPSQ